MGTLATAEKDDGRQVTVFQPTRLPYHDAINERFGVDRAGWKALTEAVFPNAKTADSIIMALSYCRARKLDPFKRPVHIVPMWSSASRRMIETIWPGIAELRTTAFRTGQAAGMEAAVFGQTIERTFEGSHDNQARQVVVSFPEWCQITVWRMLNGQRISFASPKVYWLESYAKWRDTQVPNEMWAKRPFGQIEKCTEAAALRRAFPEEVGNDYAAEEMEGQRLIEDHGPAKSDGPPAPPPVSKIEHKPPMPEVARDESDLALVEAGRDNGQQEVWGDDPGPLPTFLDRNAKQHNAIPLTPTGETQWLKDLDGALSGCADMVSFGEQQKKVMMPMKARVSADAWAKAQGMAEDNFRRIQTSG